MEDKLYKINEINKTLKSYLYHQNSSEKLMETNSQVISPTPIPRKTHHTSHHHHNHHHRQYLTKDKDFFLWSSNSKSSILLDEETSSGCGCSSSGSASNDTQNLLLLNTLPPPYVPSKSVNSHEQNHLISNLACTSTSSMGRNKSVVVGNQETQTLSTATQTFPRKPRRPIKKSSIHANAAAAINSQNLYCFVNTSYAVSSSPHLDSNSQLTLNRHLSSNQVGQKMMIY